MDFLKDFVNLLADPRLFFVMSVVALALLVWKREALTANWVGYGSLGFLSLFFLWAAWTRTSGSSS